MSDSTTAVTREQRELFLSVRMNWLRWLGTPIQLLWHVIVEAALAFWRLVKIAVTGLRGVYGRRSLVMAGIGGSVFFAVILLFTYLAGISGTPQLAAIGPILGLLPIAWTYGEVTSIAKLRRDNPDAAPDPAALTKGNGFRVAGTMALYVAVLVLALLVQALTAYLIAIPGVGPILLAVVLIPDVVFSALAIISIILFSFGLVVLPSHLLSAGAEKPEGNIIRRFVRLNGTLLSALKENWYWVQILIVAPLASIFAAVVALPVALLVFSSLGLTTGLIGAVTAFSETARQALAGLSIMISGSAAGIEALPVSVKIGLVLMVLSLSVILGFALSPAFAGVPSIFHTLYRERQTGKTWPFIVLLIVSIILGFLFFGAISALVASLTSGFAGMM